ncbi:PIN domain-containing protein [Lacihabitans soyangensis]|uniref:Type II toxin-antitoxin system VapC family toxin n=1 Tax=Lacihabitans soyangensis TaxID=869394 RepID=A0AAE3H2P4_9BACT|nr:PIN domain-containing protein [Lacihabitans soyangensis]MCP9762884.1 type II toxin-antitoxin system VapC family toxin [Lacihabitans soyangensis]
MNGSKYFLDTNAITALLQGKDNLVNVLKNASWIGISIINQLEFLANPNLKEEDITIFQSFLDRIEVIGLGNDNKDLLSLTLEIRKRNKLKLPDSIIAASAIYHKSILITNDFAFDNIKSLKVIRSQK